MNEIGKVAVISKSRLLSWLQCPKKLWLQVNMPSEGSVDSSARARMDQGYVLGALAQALYDSKGKGCVLQPVKSAQDAARETGQALLKRKPIFEATFVSGGARCSADVLLPITRAGKKTWRMVEVKSSSKIKDYHLDDVAIQVHIARASGVPLDSVSIATVDSSWVYAGDGNYEGLLVEADQTEKAFARGGEVKQWIAGAHAVLAKRKEPKAKTGNHCDDPFPCEYLEHCRAAEPSAERPIVWLPGRQSKGLQTWLQDQGVGRAKGPAEHQLEMADAPDEFLSARQKLVKKVSLSGRRFANKKGARAALELHALPAYFLDFETIAFTVPVWEGTRPYQQIPFQFSVHKLSKEHALTQPGNFLDLSGQNPMKACADALIAACGAKGPVFAYSAQFEIARIRELASCFPLLEKPLLAIVERVVDLLPIFQNHYYHPAQEGSWSIKAVLPTVDRTLNYKKLEGVQNGGMAQDAYRAAVEPNATAEEKKQIEAQLRAYCAMDTLATVKLYQFMMVPSKAVAT